MPLKQVLSERASGILLHVSSLPGPYGIGDLGAAQTFIDFLHRSGQSYWQFLPLCPTGPIFGNSPYMSFSAFAGNPLFISPDLLHQDGLLTVQDLADHPVFSEYFVEFDKVTTWKKQLLARAWKRFDVNFGRSDFECFQSDNDWLDKHCLFMALKKKFKLAPWYDWPEEIRSGNKKSLLLAAEELAESIDYYKFEQYMFSRQWELLRDYARRRGVRLIGDLPIYVGFDSVDVWANQNIFDLHKRSRQPVRIAGVPPDYFSSTGQRWGNPLYRWNTRKAVVKEQLYTWWEERLRTIFTLVDVIRIDHFRGFESYWSIPAADETAENGVWKKGPGLPFFREMEKRLGYLQVIAEDLGIITPAVEELRDILGYPGMKILQFAFGETSANPYLPFNYDKNCVVYPGTHDNDTSVGWYLDPEVSPSAKAQLRKAVNKENTVLDAVNRDFIYLAHSSTAMLSVLPMQDILGFGSDCRMNKPSTGEGNWTWRCAERYFNPENAAWLSELTHFFGRQPKMHSDENNSGEEQ